MENNNFGKLISELRNKKGLTQKELAVELHVSDKTVSRWETGGNLPTFDMLMDMSKYFKVPLNDLIIARASSDSEDDKIVQDIIREFTRVENRNSRILKAVICIAIVAVLFLTAVVIFSRSYNRFKVYKVSLESNDFYLTEGIYVETKIKDSLFLSDLRIKNLDIKSSDILLIDLYYIEDNKEYIIQSYTDLKRIQFFSNESYIKIDDLSDYIDNLYLKVRIIDSKNNETEYETQLKFLLDFSNNKVYSDSEQYYFYKRNADLTPEEIKSILVSNGFEETSGNTLWKNYKSYTIRYRSDTNKLNITFEKNNLNYHFDYLLGLNILSASIFDENNVEIENYTYDTLNEKIIKCKIGLCNNYKEAMTILNEKILYLLHN